MKKFIFIISFLVLLIFVSGCIGDRCAGIADEVKKTLCYQNLVKQTKDPSICETKMPGIPEKNVCYFNLATFHNDHTYCEKITGKSTREECYSEIVLSTGDRSLCENIETESRKEFCLEQYVGT